MEDVLEVSAEPYDPTRPKVNFDETRQPRLHETRPRLPAQPGKPQRFDYEYERNGTRNLFLFVEPQTGERHVHVTEQRTKVGFEALSPDNVTCAIRHEESMWSPQAKSSRIGMAHTMGAAHRLGLH